MPPFLSICIPTYNRIDRLKKLVLNILCSPLQDIEIVVLDNCSTDDTLNILNEINDDRLFVYSNNENIGGILNGFIALKYCKGRYSILCLDKDWINIEWLTEFTNVLKKNDNIVTGYCNLNITDKADHVLFHAGFEALSNLAYLSKHPSGDFYRTEKYKNLDILDKLIFENKTFPFLIELINAELAYRGDGLLVNIPLITTENIEDAAKSKSKTYTSKDCFFFPNQRIKEYCKYILHVSSLPITKKEKRKLIKRIFRQGFLSCTIGYKNIMKNNILLWHYSINQKRLFFNDFIYYTYKYFKSFLILNIYMDKIEKILFIVEQNIYLCLKLFMYVLIKKMYFQNNN